MLDALARWPDAVVFDAASVKRPIAAALAAADPARFLLSHPLAGREASGFAASDPDLFAGAVWAACPLPATPVTLLAQLSALNRPARRGARPSSPPPTTTGWSRAPRTPRT